LRQVPSQQLAALSAAKDEDVKLFPLSHACPSLFALPPACRHLRRSVPR
jgi:hypothetical protein